MDALTVVAASRAKNPFIDWVMDTPWDGTPRLDNLLIDYLKPPIDAEDSEAREYYAAVARIALCGAYMRACSPGAQLDYMPVLEGPEGCRKSSFIRMLLPSEQWFTDTVNERTMTDPKRESEELPGRVFAEMAELDKFSNAALGDLKHFITRRGVSGQRAAYGRCTQDYPRTCVLWGTTNDRRYLRGDGRNRRFLPVSCGVTEADPVDTYKLCKERKQIWIEARNYLLDNHADALQMPAHLMPVWQRMIEDARLIDASTEQCDAWLDSIHSVDYQNAHSQLSWRTGYVMRVDPLVLWRYALQQTKPPDDSALDKLTKYLDKRPDFHKLDKQKRVDGRSTRRAYERPATPS
jgi:predicted P-loop ATPase